MTGSASGLSFAVCSFDQERGSLNSLVAEVSLRLAENRDLQWFVCREPDRGWSSRERSEEETRGASCESSRPDEWALWAACVRSGVERDGLDCLIVVHPRSIVLGPLIDSCLLSDTDLAVVASECQEAGDFLRSPRPPLVSIIRLDRVRNRLIEVLQATSPFEAFVAATKHWSVGALSHRPLLLELEVHSPTDDFSDSSFEAKTKVLELLVALRDSGVETDRQLASTIADADATGFYRLLILDRVDVLTHCDPGRQQALSRMLDSVPGGVRVVCAVNGSSTSLAASLQAEVDSGKLVLVDSPASSPYPFNVLRNRALRNATGRYVLIVDVDFVFLPGFWFLLLAGNKTVLEDGGWISPMAVTGNRKGGREIAVNHRSGAVDAARLRSGSVEVRALPLFRHHSRWHPRDAAVSGAGLVDITDRLRVLRHTPTPAEPWGLVRRDLCALGDEDFAGRGGDKQQLVAAMIDRGGRFFASRTAAMFHLDHPSAASSGEENLSSFTLWRRRYRWLGHRYLLLSNGEHLLGVHMAEEISGALTRILRGVSDLPNWAQADDVTECVRSMRRGSRVVLCSTPYMAAYASKGFRVISVVRDPRLASGYGGEDLKADRPTDCRLIRRFAAGRPDPLAAAVSADAMTLVVDADHLGQAERRLASILGIEIGLTGFSKPARSEDRKADDAEIPCDVALYDKLREWFDCSPRADSRVAN